MVNKGDDMKALMSPNSLYQEAYNAICELALIKGVIGDNYDILRLKELVEVDKLIGETLWMTNYWVSNIEINDVLTPRKVIYCSIHNNGEILLHFKDGALPFNLVGKYAYKSKAEAESALKAKDGELV